MKVIWSDQFKTACIVVQSGDNHEDIHKKAVDEGAFYFDGEDQCLVLSFEDDSKRLVGPELYTEEAFKRSKIIQ